MIAKLEKGGVWCAWVGAFFALSLLLPVVAHAQDALEEDDVPLLVDDADWGTDAGQYLQQGLQYYDQENYQAASLLFYRVLTTEDASDAVYSRAEYDLGRTLYRMGLFFPSLFFFDGVVAFGADHPYFLNAYPWLLRLHRRLPGEPFMMERLAQYEDFFPDQIEEKYLDEMAFLIGRYHYNRGFLDEAQIFWSFVSSASRFYVRAQYLTGIADVQEREAQGAIDAFEQVITSVLESDDRSDETRRLAEMAVLGMARTFYSTRDYERAIAYYDQVPASSRYWLDALFEKAWALFQLEEFNLALGNLHSLSSPFFNDEFYPEGMYLQAVIFFRNCQFEAVRVTVEEFGLEYGPLLDQLEELTDTIGMDEEYFDVIMALRGEQEQDYSPQLQRLLNTAVDDLMVQDSVDFVAELDREMGMVQGADPGWLNTDLADEILTQIGLERSLAAGRAGENVRIRVERARDELRNLDARGTGLLVETDLAEQAVISNDLREEMVRADSGLTPPPVDEEHLLWHFTGSYWRDELGYYWYALSSRCADLGL